MPQVIRWWVSGALGLSKDKITEPSAAYHSFYTVNAAVAHKHKIIKLSYLPIHSYYKQIDRSFIHTFSMQLGYIASHERTHFYATLGPSYTWGKKVTLISTDEWSPILYQYQNIKAMGIHTQLGAIYSLNDWLGLGVASHYNISKIYQGAGIQAQVVVGKLRE